jgi:predicted metal-binding membrane protein
VLKKVTFGGLLRLFNVFGLTLKLSIALRSMCLTKRGAIIAAMVLIAAKIYNFTLFKG